MAETDLGGIVVEISADVKGLLDGSQQAVESLKAIEKSSGTTATGMGQLNATADAVAAALTSMSSQGKVANALLEQIANNLKRASEPQGEGISQTTRQLQAMSEQVKIAEIALNQGGRAAAIYAAQLKMAADASLDERAAMASMTGRLYDMRSSTETAGKGLGNMRGIMQQAGYQIGDFVVQVQSGQNALVAFSQQGSQLAGAFGPVGAVVGVVLTLASIIGGQLIANMGGAVNKSKELDNSIASLNQIMDTGTQGAKAFSDEFVRISQTNQELANALKLTAELKAKLALKDLADEYHATAEGVTHWYDSLKGGIASVKDFDSNLRALGITAGSTYAQAMATATNTTQGSQYLWQNLSNTLATLENQFGLSEEQAYRLAVALNNISHSAVPAQSDLKVVNEILTQQRGATDEQNRAAIALMDTFNGLGQKALQLAEDMKVATGQMPRLTKGLDDAVQHAKDELELSKLTGKARARRAAELNAEAQMTDKNNQAQKDAVKQIGELAAESWANTDAQHQATKASNKAASEAASQAKTVAKAHQKDTDALADLQRQTDVTTAGQLQYARAQAVIAGQNKMSQYASPDQVKQAGELAGQIWDANQAMKAQQQVKAQIAAGDVASGANPNAQIDNEEGQNLDQLNAQRQLGLITFQQYQDAKTAIVNKAAQDRQKIAFDEQQSEMNSTTTILGAAASSFDSLANMAAQSAGKNSGAYKAMFALSKAFSIAQASMALNTAIMQALSDPTAITPAQKFANMAAVATAGAGLLASISSAGMGGGKKYGGGVNASTMYRTGENGPEIYQANNGNQYMIPGQRGQVIPTGSGGPIQQNITFSIQTTGGIDDATMTRMAQMMKQVSLSTIKDQQRPNGLLQRSR